MAVLSSCGGGGGGGDDGDIVTNNTLELSAYSLSFTGDAGDMRTIDVASNADYSVKDYPSWVAVQQSGKTITVTASANPSTTESRSGSLRVVCGQINRTVQLTQSPAKEKLTLARQQFSFDAAGGSATVELTANCAWETANLPTWLTVAPATASGNATLTITAAASTDEQKRTATFQVRTVSRALSHDIAVEQAPYSTTLTLAPTELTLPAKNATGQISIGGNATWTAASDAAWCHIDTANGSGQATINIALDDNPATAKRTATITVKSSQQTLTAAITQRGGTVPGENDNKPM